MVSSQSTISRIHYGVIFKRVGEIVPVTSFWEHTVRISLPPEMQYRENERVNCTALASQQRWSSHTPHRERCEKFVPILNTLLTLQNKANEFTQQLHHDITNLAHRLEDENLRRKRNVLGRFLSWSTGVALEDDVNKMRLQVSEMELNVAEGLRQITRSSQAMTSFQHATLEHFQAIEQMNLLLRKSHAEHFDRLNSFVSESIDMEKALAHALRRLYHFQLTVREADRFQAAMLQAIQGTLSPVLLPPKWLYMMLHNMSRYWPENTNLAYTSLKDFYTHTQFFVAHKNRDIFFTFKIPLTHFPNPLKVYRVLKVPVLYNYNSSHVTVLEEPAQYYAEVKGVKMRRYVLEAVTDPTVFGRYPDASILDGNWHYPHGKSCLQGLFAANNQHIKRYCSFNMQLHAAKPSLIALNSTHYLATLITIEKLFCGSDIYKTSHVCQQCILQLPCNCWIQANGRSLPPSSATCQNNATTNLTVVSHVTNLAVWNTLLEDVDLGGLSADTLLTEQIPALTPQVQELNTNFSKAQAFMDSTKFDLRRIVNASLAEDIAFRSHAEAIAHDLFMDSQRQKADVIETVITPWYETHYLNYGFMALTILTLLITVINSLRLKFALLAIANSIPQQVRALDITTSQPAENRTLPARLEIPSTQSTMKTTVIATTTIHPILQEINKLPVMSHWSFYALWIILAAVITVASVYILYRLYAKYCRKYNTFQIVLMIGNKKESCFLYLNTLPHVVDAYKVTVSQPLQGLTVTGCTLPKVILHWKNVKIEHVALCTVSNLQTIISVHWFKAFKIKRMIRNGFWYVIYSKTQGHLEKIQAPFCSGSDMIVQPPHLASSQALFVKYEPESPTSQSQISQATAPKQPSPYGTLPSYPKIGLYA